MIEYRMRTGSARTGFVAVGVVLYGGDRCHALAEEWAICLRVHALANTPCLPFTHMRPAAPVPARLPYHDPFMHVVFSPLSRMPLVAALTHLVKS